MFNRKFLALFLGGCVGAAAQAESAAGYGGVVLGLSKPSALSLSSRFGFGANAGGLLVDGTVGVGAFLDYSTKSETDTNGATPSVGVMAYGLEGNYYFKDYVPGLFAGLKLGMAHVSYGAEVNAQNFPGAASYSPFLWGVTVGYDYALGSGLSVGLQTDLLMAASKTAGGIAYSSFTIWNLLLGVKYWF